MVLVLVAIPLLVAACDNGDDDDVTPTPIPTPTPTPTPSDIEMASIPRGSFSMGSTEGDDWYERPVHSVMLLPFYMARYEVTYAQWVKVRDWGEAHGYSFNMPEDRGGEEEGGTQDENHPVTGIEWYDAVLWCNALSEMEGRTPSYYTSSAKSTVYRSGRVDIQNDWVKWDADGYRLPTEAEWEYACRAGTTTKYSFGNSISRSNANYYHGGDSYENRTTPVGSYRRNVWDLYDMHGNVSEWVWDWYGILYYGSGGLVAGVNPRGPSSGSYRVLRGGHRRDSPEGLRSAARGSSPPDDRSFRADYKGFRPVRSQGGVEYKGAD